MRRFFTSLTLVAVAVAALTSASYASKKGTSYVLVNDDNAGAANTVSVYTISGNTLTYEGVISTGGEGLGGGYFGYNRWGYRGGGGIGLGTVLVILLVCYMLGAFR